MQDLPAMPSTTAHTYFSTVSIASPTAMPPPQTATELQGYLQVNSGTPAATSNATPVRIDSRPSIDSVGAGDVNMTPASKASPSDIFGGVDQLLRTSDNGQDWWMRDQSQLAVGFDNWTEAEAAGVWFAAGMTDQGGIVQHTSGASPSMVTSVPGPLGGSMGVGMTSAAAHGSGLTKAMSAMESANAAGLGQVNASVNGVPSLGHMGAGIGFNGYDESQWYS